MSAVQLVVRNALWGKKKVDVLVARGRIAALAPAVRKTRVDGAEEFDAGGLT
ncbi:MAG TPA: dihydroorotase, partial [Desulfovibrio sp.]|nr:dihydroorotase [Desulfovibrio sp.]